MSFRGVAPNFIYKIDHRFPRTRDFKINGKKYTLKSKITKLIVYSNCATKLNIVLWRMTPEEEIIKTTEPWEIKPKMNVICLCRYRMAEEWADEYLRVEIKVHSDTDMLLLKITPVLHRRWQVFVLADSYPLPLAETIALSLGMNMLRQGDAVQQAKREDKSVDHAMTTNAEHMKKMELSKAQKILLRFNVNMKNSCFCYKMTFRTTGKWHWIARRASRMRGTLFIWTIWGIVSRGSRSSGTACVRTRTGTTLVTATQCTTLTQGSVCRT